MSEKWLVLIRFSHFLILDSFKCITQLCLLKISFCLGLWDYENVFDFYIPEKMTPGDVLKGVKIGHFSDIQSFTFFSIFHAFFMTERCLIPFWNQEDLLNTSRMHWNWFIQFLKILIWNLEKFNNFKKLSSCDVIFWGIKNYII